MNLLLDQNLSFRLCQPLASFFGSVSHVKEKGLQIASDQEIWDYAMVHECAIVSKDSDFMHRALLQSQRSFKIVWPKVIWVNLGNASTDTILRQLTLYRLDISSFLADTEERIYILS